MSWNVLLIGLGIFLGALSLHIFVWRVFKPRNYLFGFFFIFFLFPPVAVLSLGNFFFGLVPGNQLHTLSLVEWGNVFFLHFLLSCSYILSYPAVQAKCPSLMILLLIDCFGLEGATLSELEGAYFSDDKDDVIGSGLEQLVNVNLISYSKGFYSLTFSGKIFIGFFLLFRKFLGLPLGKG